MYYEERMVDGVLCFRTSANGQWQQMTLQEVTQMYLGLQKEVDKTIAILESITGVSEYKDNKRMDS